LIAVEVDPVLAEGLRERFSGRPEVTVVEADVLEATPEELLAHGRGGPPYVMVGNLPYYIGTAIVRRFLVAAVKPRRLTVMLQAEVAENIAARPGEMTYLSVQMQMHADAKLLFYIPAKAFKPPPKIRSAVVQLDVRDGPAVEVDDPDAFLELVRAGFSAPRKQLRNSLGVGLRITGAEAERVIVGAGLEPSRRPAELSMQDWKSLYYEYRATEVAA
jgi:16S rRNA (adenine1518-N6/adenine1519-N6)-dimethyltransferase